DRHWHGEERDHRRTPVLQEDEYDEDDERDGFEQRDHDVRDRGPDEPRRVEADAVIDAGGEARPRVIEKFRDTVSSVHRVGSRREIDEDDTGRLLVEPGEGLVVLRAELDPPEIADAKERPVGLRTQHDIAELLWLDEASGGIDRILQIDTGGDRRLADGARWILTVLRLDGRGDVRGGHAERRHLRRVDPHAHAVV